MTTGSGTTAGEEFHAGAHVERLAVVAHGRPANTARDPHPLGEAQPNGRPARAGIETKRQEGPPAVQTRPGAERPGADRWIQMLWAGPCAATPRLRMRAVRAVFMIPTFHDE